MIRTRRVVDLDWRDAHIHVNWAQVDLTSSLFIKSVASEAQQIISLYHLYDQVYMLSKFGIPHLLV